MLSGPGDPGRRVGADHLVGAAEHPGAGILGDGGVRPPVEGDVDVVGIDHPDMSLQHPATLGKSEVDLPEQAVHPFVLPDAHEIAVDGLPDAAEQGLAGRHAVAVVTEIPLDTTGEPGVADGEVGGLEDRIGEQQILSRGQIGERVQPSAEFWKEDRPEQSVVEFYRSEICLLPVAAVAILNAIGQHTTGVMLAHPLLLGGRQAAVAEDREVVALIAQRRQRILPDRAGRRNAEHSLANVHGSLLGRSATRMRGLPARSVPAGRTLIGLRGSTSRRLPSDRRAVERSRVAAEGATQRAGSSDPLTAGEHLGDDGVDPAPVDDLHAPGAEAQCHPAAE